MDHPQHICLRLDASLTVPHADALMAKVAEALEAAEAVTLDLSGATEIDVSFLQILIAGCKTASQKNKSLLVLSTGSELLAKEAERCGLSLSPSSEGVYALPRVTDGSLQ